MGTRDHAEFERCLLEHQSMVFSIALRLLRDRALAEEIAQDVFLQLHERLPALGEGDHVKFWLRRACYHRCIDEIRRRRLRPKTGLSEIREPAAKENSGDPLLNEMLRKLVGALPEKARAIVVLRFQEDLDPSEIARILEIPASSVKSLLHRTLRLLRGKMERTANQADLRVQTDLRMRI